MCVGERGHGQSDGLRYSDVLQLLAIAELPWTHRRKTETTEGAQKRALVDRAVISLLFMAGLRRSEVAALEWRDVLDGEEDTLVINLWSSKTDQEGEGVMRLLKAQCADAMRELRTVR